MKQQNFKNHIRIVPGFHGITFALILGALIGSIVNVTVSSKENLYSATLIVLICFILALLAFYSRRFALKAQDRAIRAEENLRHYILTGKRLDSRLRTSQIIALRFAEDAEFIPLCAKAIAENMRSIEIKKAIQQWKGDYHRV